LSFDLRNHLRLPLPEQPRQQPDHEQEQQSTDTDDPPQTLALQVKCT
jgi:hypothetical protein